MDILVLFARILISSLYLWAGFAKTLDWKGTVAYMRSRNFPLIPLALPAAILLQVGGGLMVLLGFYTRFGACILILFTIPAAIKMHNFWAYKDAALRLTEKTLFMKDIAILGGLLLLLIQGGGFFSAN